MIRESIIKAIEKEGIPIKTLAREMNIPYNSFYDWLQGYKDTFALKHIETVCKRLRLHLVNADLNDKYIADYFRNDKRRNKNKSIVISVNGETHTIDELISNLMMNSELNHISILDIEAIESINPHSSITFSHKGVKNVIDRIE